MKTLFILLLAPAAFGQPVVAPTNESTGPVRGKNVSEYNVTQWFEAGYRFKSVDGNSGVYRSDVNFGNGIRLLGSSMTVHSKDGHGKYFDEIVLTTQGLGNDPYESASLRIQKNKLYRYDMLWRSNEYFNPGLTIAGGQHFMDTTRRLQDHDLVLLPQSSVRFFLGYSRNAQDGPALSTVQVFDSRGDEFPFGANIRRVRNEYRVGGEGEFAGFRLNVLRGWDNFQEDTRYLLGGPSAGNNPNDRVTLASFTRNEPYHGNSPYWRANLTHNKSKLFYLSGRFTHTAGSRNFVFDEFARGTSRFGADQNRQIVVTGNARRPVTTGSMTFSLFPSKKWTLSNHTAVSSTRIDGDSIYREFNNGSRNDDLINFQYLGIRTVSNLTDATFKATGWLGFYTGYQVSSREIKSITVADFVNPQRPAPDRQDNTVHSGTFGVRLQPVKPLRISLDSEIGRADKPIYPISENNYHALGGRVQWRSKQFQLSASLKSNYNTNSGSLYTYGSRGRNFSYDGSWIPRNWFSIDAGYSKLHMYTLSGIAYFSAGEFIDNGRSLYVSNIHAGTLSARFSIQKKADIVFGFHRVQDTGDGRLAAGSTAFQAAQTFPLAYTSPLARISVRLHERLRWNFGYQMYDYSELWLLLQNYRAHTGYTSLTWSF